ncbi:thiol-disulfide isomerase/thioredoxin [Pedobacter sp. AK017]|uniref:TlpA disulfide reductase family protein n=1 Tax=Pedobacter sp. AK017 TaxID=2723073 RepID=UPI00161FE582|nr:TlpA disulfide reductase family protein [Pedobacter sp. AK017]MBB5440097.1 thiol-disulfide isomerase/thioredoxin [Pedobacter sp. AK017]
MFKTTKLIVLAALCLNFSLKANAQAIKQKPSIIQPIKIGDKIPDTLWNKDFTVINHPQNKPTLKLKDYGNKLIILDFWATYCHPCVESLDYLHSIKDEFKDQLVVIPVQVYDRAAKGIPFMQKKGWIWPSITGDTLLNKVMLLRYLTGYGIAWIKDGKLLAVPSKKQFNAETIRKIIQGEPVEFINRKGKNQ